MHTKSAPSVPSTTKMIHFEYACALLQYLWSTEFDKSRCMVSPLHKMYDLNNIFRCIVLIYFIYQISFSGSSFRFDHFPAHALIYINHSSIGCAWIITSCRVSLTTFVQSMPHTLLNLSWTL